MVARRIAIVLSGFELAGAELQALHLARGLVRDHGREVLVAGFGDGRGAVAVCCTELGLPTLRLAEAGGRWPWLARWRSGRSLRALRAFRPDVLVPFTLWPNVACALGRQSSGASAVLWNQRDEGIYTTYPHVGLLRQALRTADRLVANSAAGRSWLVGQDVPARRISVIHNGCDLAPPFPERSAARRSLGLPEEPPIAVMVAHDAPRKDHLTLIRAWAQALPALPPGALLLLAGRGDFSAVRAWIATHGMHESIRLLGLRDDVPRLVAASDLLVHASLGEGLPNAVIEALLLARPVVGTDLPGLREALGPHAAGRLVPPRDPAALAGAITQTLTTPPSQEALDEVAAWARQTFAIPRMVTQFAELIDQAVAAASGAAGRSL